MELVIDHKEYVVKFYRTGDTTPKTTTNAELFLKEGESLVPVGVKGIAKLHHKDKFVRKVGLKVALSKLIELLVLPKEIRQYIWNKFFESHRK